MDLREQMTKEYDKEIILDKWGVKVRPYLTLDQIANIVSQLVTCNNGLERDKMLVANIIVACTDLYYEDMDFNYDYEQILYSGFWDDLMKNCPIIRSNIETIHREVAEILSPTKGIMGLIDMAAEKVENLDVAKIEEIVKSLLPAEAK